MGRRISLFVSTLPGTCSPRSTLSSFERITCSSLSRRCLGIIEILKRCPSPKIYSYLGNTDSEIWYFRGLKAQAQFALDHASIIIDLFSSLFGIDYPLPKCDLLAVHEFSHGAMENWGLITYRTTALLFDETASDIKYKNRVAYVVAHELAHQWYGNLVTMDWWNELWLNEGFATWAGWLATDQ